MVNQSLEMGDISQSIAKLDTVEAVATITDGVDTQQVSVSTVIVNSTNCTNSMVVLVLRWKGMICT